MSYDEHYTRLNVDRLRFPLCRCRHGLEDHHGEKKCRRKKCPCWKFRGEVRRDALAAG